MKNNNICVEDTLEKQLEDSREYIKWNSTEIANKTRHIKWLYTVIIFLLSIIFYMIGIITQTHHYTVVCENKNGLELPITIPTWGIEFIN